MKVLVTGASGLVGSHVAERLTTAGHQVVCLLRDPARRGALEGIDVEVARGDVNAPQSLKPALKGVEAVVHAAGIISYWKPRAAELHKVNVDGTRALLDAAASAGVRRVLLTSSIAAVGYVERGELGDEDTPYNWGPMGIAYCETKRAAEALVLGDPRLEGVAVNPGIIIGPRDVNFGGGRLIAQVYRGQVPGIPPGSTTVATVQDVTEGHLRALERGSPGRRYILGGHPMSFLELFQTIGAVLGRKVPDRAAPAFMVQAMAAVLTARASLDGKEPRLTPQLAALSIRNRKYSSDRAVRELYYQVSPLEPAIEATRRWYVERRMI